MKRICLPSAVFTLPSPLTFPTIDLTDDEDATGVGNVILTGALRYGEVIPTCAGIEIVAADVVATFLFSPNVATVSRSLPPPGNKRQN